MEKTTVKNASIEALNNAETIIQEWLETAQELGRPIPEPRGRLVSASSATQTAIAVTICCTTWIEGNYKNRI